MFQRLVWYSPIAVLCIVAVWQIQRAHSTDLSPWKGGGFGMFSTVDQPAMRYLKVFLIEEGQETPIALPESLKPRTQRTKADPSKDNLEQVAEHLQGIGLNQLRQWAVDDNECDSSDEAEDADSQEPEADDLDEVIATVPQLRVELWRMQFDHSSKDLSASKYLETTVSLKASDD